ncbi:MAB_1171c family putative transporter [Streptomyces sp. NPDC059009]|uniref:MAB_1171c family putative transporter n=1 Tax=Streptomyces sp. NPDC059009 TaxID=3346694 RepID=UPI0036A47B9B
MDGLGFWLFSGITLIAFCVKAPGLRDTRSPLYASVCGVLLLSGLLYGCSNPDVIGFLNDVTGVPNFAAPLVYGLLTAVSALVLTLLIYWRGGPPEQARRTALWWLIIYGLVIVAEIVMFVLGDASVERRVDLDTYYARTPFIREMILLYLLAHTSAAIMAASLCWRWVAEVKDPPWLRRGLRVLICGFFLNLCLDASKLTAIGARWTGTDWDFLNTKVAVLFEGLCLIVTSIGFVVPHVGPRLGSVYSTVTAHRALRPLWQLLHRATPTIARSLPLRWWNIDLRLTRRIAEIHDGRLALRPFRDARVAAFATAQARELGLTPDDTAAVVEAAVLVAAARSKAIHTHPPAGIGDTPVGDDSPLQRAALVRASRMLRNSPIVSAARAYAREQEASTHGSATRQDR